MQTAARPSTSAPGDGSRTLTLNPAPPRDESGSGEDDAGRSEGVLRLRGRAMPGRGVQWQEDVIDNEGLGRKKSKICCIYHKPKAFDESSDESDSSDSDGASSDGSVDSRDGRQRAAAARRRRRPRHHHHDHDTEGCGHGEAPTDAHASGSGSAMRNNGGSSTMVERPASAPPLKPEPNAYERGAGGGNSGGSAWKGKDRA